MIHPFRSWRARRDAAEAAEAARITEALLGHVQPAPVVPDPANPGCILRLEPGPGEGQTLIVRDATSGQEVRIPVPADIPDPITAVAWTFTDPNHPVPCTPPVYAALEAAT